MTNEGEFRGHVTPYSLSKAPAFSAAGPSMGRGQDRNIKSRATQVPVGRGGGGGVRQQRLSPEPFISALSLPLQLSWPFLPVVVSVIFLETHRKLSIV